MDARPQARQQFCPSQDPAILREQAYADGTHLDVRRRTHQLYVDYFASSRSLTMHPGHREADWQAVLDFVRAEVQATIDEHGCLDVTKITGALVARKEADR